MSSGETSTRPPPIGPGAVALLVHELGEAGLVDALSALVQTN